MTDELSARLADLLDGTYDCVDRIVLNGYHSVCYSAGGFRLWWRSLMGGSEEQLDNAHLMRLAGRFSRRVRGFAKAHRIPVIDCRRGERKHDLAQDYLAEHSVGRGLFMILVGRAVAPVWDVQRTSGGGIHLTKKLPYVNHYSFHIMDAQWGHITIKMAGHPPSSIGHADHPERARVRRLPSHQTPSHLHQGRQLLHSDCRPHRPGQDSRHLVRSTDCMAPGPGV